MHMFIPAKPIFYREKIEADSHPYKVYIDGPWKGANLHAMGEPSEKTLVVIEDDKTGQFKTVRVENIRYKIPGT